MDGKRLGRKLRRKARRLARWARRHGVDHVTVFAIGPDDGCPAWYCDAAAYAGGERVASESACIPEGEL